MAEDKDKTKIKLDPNAPITAEELREHEVVDHLLKTHPELQEKSEVGSAVTTGVKKFSFTGWDLLSSVGFGLVFGVVFGSIGYFGAETQFIKDLFPHAAKEIAAVCGSMGIGLGIKSALTHPFAEMSKNFYDKCKEGYAEAKEHNQAVQFLKQRVSAIKMYKQKHFMKGIMENPDGVIQNIQPSDQTSAALPEYENPRSRVVDAILSEKRKVVPEMTWAQRTEAQAASPTQPSL